MSKLKFVNVTGRMGDETIGYDIILGEEYTVQDILNGILKVDHREFGEIRIREKKEGVIDVGRLEYNRGVITYRDLSSSYMLRKVKGLSSCGGWGRMDYYIDLL